MSVDSHLFAAPEMHCALCRVDLLGAPSIAQFPRQGDAADWEIQVLSLLNVARDVHLPPEIYTFRVNLANDEATLFYDPPLKLTRNKDGLQRNLRVSPLNENDHNVGISFDAKATTALHFILGTYGLQAIRLGYRDGTSSPWLGSPGQGYYCATFGTSEDTISILSDKFRVIGFGFDGDGGDQDRTLFAHDMKPHVRDQVCIVDVASWPALLDCPGWRLCRYLPLRQADGSHAAGLSIYRDGVGLRGVVAHGKRPQLIGRRAGPPIYFHFLPDEHLTFLALCALPRARGPYPLIMTNRGRSAVFCPYGMTWNMFSQWSPVARGPITGFVVDALTMPQSCFNNIGVSVDSSSAWQLIIPSDLMLLSLDARSPPPFARDSFLTTATLTGTAQLHVRKAGDWCSGLCIRHHDGFIETLGRWDPSDEKAILHIYDSHREGPLTALTFRYSTEDRYQSRIADIIAGDLPRVGCTYVWRAADEQPRIAWWLTNIRDHITPWKDGAFPSGPFGRLGLRGHRATRTPPQMNSLRLTGRPQQPSQTPREH